MKILVICTGNSCRSQMAEGILEFYNPNLTVFSAGTSPAKKVHPVAVKVMQEIGIDISTNCPKSVAEFTNQSFDYLITVCNGAKEVCPNFTGNVEHKLYLGFNDPASFIGTEQEILNEFRKVRDAIKAEFQNFFNENK